METSLDYLAFPPLGHCWDSLPLSWWWGHRIWPQEFLTSVQGYGGYGPCPIPERFGKKTGSLPISPPKVSGTHDWTAENLGISILISGQTTQTCNAYIIVCIYNLCICIRMWGQPSCMHVPHDFDSYAWWKMCGLYLLIYWSIYIYLHLFTYISISISISIPISAHIVAHHTYFLYWYTCISTWTYTA